MKKSKLVDLAIFSMFGALIFISKQIMEFLPNFHAITLFIAVLTLEYRARALIPLYVFVLLQGAYSGFQLWWYPYLYIWAVAWALFMAIPKNASLRVKGILCVVFGAIHGLAYGLLYAPFQIFAFFGGDFSKMLPWVIAGLPFDAVHMCGNIVLCLLVIPLYKIIHRLEEKRIR